MSGDLVSSAGGHVGAAAPRSAFGQRPALIAAGAGGLVLSGLAFAIVLTSGQPGDRLLIAVGRVSVIAVPIAVGIWLWSQAQYERFGRLLVVAGYVWFLAALAESSNSVLYSMGRIGAWVAETVVIYLVLAFPSGRLRTTRERVLVGGMVVFTVLLFAPVALIQEGFAAPTYWASCGEDCPANAFFVLSSQPDLVDDWIRPVRTLLVTAVFIATAVLLAVRIRLASYLMRKTLAPVLVIAIVRCLAFLTVAVVMRDFGLFMAGFELVGWILVLCLPGVSLAFVAGVLRRRLYAGSALQRLARRLREEPNVRLSVVIGEAVGDPSLEVAYRMPGLQWIDEDGRSVTLPGKYSVRSTTEVRGRDGPVALLIHDRALDDQKEFLGAVGSIAVAALENRRLAAQVDASLEELHESRARIQAAADAERERMERDLHDGAQQRLVALRVRVELARELVDEDPGSGATLLGELGSELEEALDEVRALARGIYPPLLADLGIVGALRSVGRRHPVQTTIEAKGVGRYPSELERAVYFCCLEALQNVAKHAPAASNIWITLVDDDGALRFAVRDDGAGFATEGTWSGQGLTNMRDRLAAVGGELTIESAPGKGTRVLGVIPRSRSGQWSTRAIPGRPPTL